MMDLGNYITIHSSTSLDIKDYDFWELVVKHIQGVKILQVGGPKDKRIEGTIDLRGKTSINESAWIIKNAKLHLGVDSFPAHCAGAVNTPSITLFGSTWSESCKPLSRGAPVITINPLHRGGCLSPCHLAKDCLEEAPNGVGKCINLIEPETILKEISKILGEQYVKPYQRWTIGCYGIIKNGINIDLPFKECIQSYSKFADEIVIVDGNSDDGTFEALTELQKSIPILKLYRTDWKQRADEMGIQKTYARSLCTSDFLVQFDLDEYAPFWNFKNIRDVIRRNWKAQLLDIGCITPHGIQGISKKENPFKHRITRNNSRIIHSVHKQAREYDSSGNLIYCRNESDSCGFVFNDTFELVPSTILWDQRLYYLNILFKENKLLKDSEGENLYKKLLIEMYYEKIPCVLHLSWLSSQRKMKMESFWSKIPRYYRNKETGRLEKKNTGKWVDKPIGTTTEEDLKKASDEIAKEQTAVLPELKYPPELGDYLKKYGFGEEYLIKE